MADEFNDGWDENLMGDEEDRKRLEMMSEKEREEEIFKRAEKREMEKKRFEIEKKLKLQRRKTKEETKQVNKALDTKERSRARKEAVERTVTHIELMWEEWHCNWLAEVHKHALLAARSRYGPKKRNFSSFVGALPSSSEWMGVWSSLMFIKTHGRAVSTAARPCVMSCAERMRRPGCRAMGSGSFHARAQHAQHCAQCA